MKSQYDKLIVLALIMVFLGLLVAFHSQNFATEFLEQSCNLALGCLLGLVKAQSTSSTDKKDT